MAATSRKIPKCINAMMTKVVLDHRRNRNEGRLHCLCLQIGEALPQMRKPAALRILLARRLGAKGNGICGRRQAVAGLHDLLTFDSTLAVIRAILRA
ncbi:hypothetical protein [Nitratireductor luteus]|uniref:hypothetical protein n=1 Tax=Nitratireductor luteus TaxID=2976980 RepID=UPI00223FB140|nr:hypothetical protein [Nitratireductor luteus]